MGRVVCCFVPQVFDYFKHLNSPPLTPGSKGNALCKITVRGRNEKTGFIRYYHVASLMARNFQAISADFQSHFSTFCVRMEQNPAIRVSSPLGGIPMNTVLAASAQSGAMLGALGIALGLFAATIVIIIAAAVILRRTKRKIAEEEKKERERRWRSVPSACFWPSRCL